MIDDFEGFTAGEFEHGPLPEAKVPKRKKRSIREDDLEDYFCKQVALAGGFAFKLKTPGRDGAPDRFVAWPAIPDELVELKTIGGALEPSQKKWHAVYTRVTGKKVAVLWTKCQIDQWIEKRRHALARSRP